MGTKIKKCPCCGQETSDYIWVSRDLFTLGPMQKRLIGILRQAPDGLPVDEIMGQLYANAKDGGAVTRNIISVMAMQINRKMVKHGLAIRGTGGPGSVYRLVEVAP